MCDRWQGPCHEVHPSRAEERHGTLADPVFAGATPRSGIKRCPTNHTSPSSSTQPKLTREEPSSYKHWAGTAVPWRPHPHPWGLPRGRAPSLGPGLPTTRGPSERWGAGQQRGQPKHGQPWCQCSPGRSFDTGFMEGEIIYLNIYPGYSCGC